LDEKQAEREGGGWDLGAEFVIWEAFGDGVLVIDFCCIPYDITLPELKFAIERLPTGRDDLLSHLNLQSDELHLQILRVGCYIDNLRR
jgi:hypothetical protein